MTIAEKQADGDGEIGAAKAIGQEEDRSEAEQIAGEEQTIPTPADQVPDNTQSQEAATAPPGPNVPTPEQEQKTVDQSSSLGTILSDRLTLWIGVVSAAIAAGQAGTTWISGIYSESKTRIESEKSIELQRIKDTSELAEKYLSLILNSETSPQDRTLLYDALSNIDGHPLQSWAKKRYQSNMEYVARLESNARAQAEAEFIKEEQKRESEKLRLQAESLVLAMENARDIGDSAEVENLRARVLSIYAQKAVVDAKLAVVNAQIVIATNTIDKTASPSSSEIGAKLPETISTQVVPDGVSLSLKLTPEVLYPFFSRQAKARIDLNIVYLQKAMQEFQINDARLAAYIVANLATASPDLSEWAQSVEYARTHYAPGTSMGRALGNTGPDDAVLYRGRGYFGLTGKGNYIRLSQKLGLPSLVSFPEDAKKPEVAFRIGLALIDERREKIMTTLESGGILDASRLFIGGSPDENNLPRIRELYQRLLKVFQT